MPIKNKFETKANPCGCNDKTDNAENVAYVFDLDCTLLDTRPLYPAMQDNAANLLMKHHPHLSFDTASSEVVRILYENNGYVREAFEREYGICPHETIQAVYNPAFMDLDLVGVPQGMEDLLSDLSDKELYIYTNASSEYAQALLDHLSLSAYFKGIYGTDDLKDFRKPDPRSFAQFEKKAGIEEGARVIFFEDSPSNLVTAKERGWQTVFVQEFTEGNMHTNADLQTWNMIDRMVDAVTHFFFKDAKPSWHISPQHIYK